MKVLFITWDGPQVNYLESLFLPIFVALRSQGIELHILQFTWADQKRCQETFDRCALHGIPYQSVSVIRHPLRTGACLTVVNGVRLIKKLIRQWSIDVLMPRSTLPALMCVNPLSRFHVPVLFDADGLPLDERVDFAGELPGSWAQRFLRHAEAQAVRRADVVLARTPAAIDVLCSRAGPAIDKAKFHIVGNGRDRSIFTSALADISGETRREIGVDADAPLLVFAGSLGEQYCLPEMLTLFKAVRVLRPSAALLILTGTPDVANQALCSYPELQQAVTVMSVQPDRVPAYLACADLGLALRRPSFSMQAVAPIKIGEYLLSGLPVVATRGVGDTTRLDGSVGFVLESMDEAELTVAAKWFCETVLSDRAGFSERSRQLGCDAYSLEASVDAYASAFEGLRRPSREFRQSKV